LTETQRIKILLTKKD
jgi:hypothetical protein